MKKQAFVETLNTIKKWHDRSVEFGKAVSQARVDAGDDPDFAHPYSYEFLPGGMIDELVHAVAQDFETPQYSAEKAEDFINWWIWECDFGQEAYIHVPDAAELLADPDAQPVEELMAIMEIDGRVFECTTPEVLYDAIMYDIQHS